MSWYKEANDPVFEIQTTDDRNIVNEKIRFFNVILGTLDKLGKIVFQNAKLAKDINQTLSDEEIFSAYPEIRSILREASDVALDSPWKFSDMCKGASVHIQRNVRKLEQARKEYTNKILPDRMKGWVDNYGRK